eukprot:gene27720-33484_t
MLGRVSSCVKYACLRGTVKGKAVVRSLSFKILDKELESNLLSMFPEYKLSLDFQKQGNISQAISALSRVHEVLLHAVGHEAPISSQVTLQLASLHRAQGTFKKAVQIVQEHPSTLLDYRVEKEVFSATTEVLNHNVNQAVQHAQKAVHICEREQDFANPDNTVFSKAYSSLGVSLLYQGQIQEAETYLQMAARWAQTPYEHAMSLNNRGALLWFNLLHPDPDNLPPSSPAVPPFSLWKHEEDVCIHRPPLPSADVNTAYLSPVLTDTHPWIEGAIGAWTEALSALSPAATSPSSNSASASPCSTPTPSTSTSTSTTTTTTIVEEDVNTLATQATVHINHATLLLLMGKGKEGNEHLSQAVKILSSRDDDARLQPLLGCVLRRIGGLHMAGLQAVTAEGLFNASLSKLSGAWGKHNGVYVYEKGLCTAQYGHLLKRWEKREEKGVALVSEGKAVAEGVKKYDHGVVLIPLVLLP